MRVVYRHGEHRARDRARRSFSELGDTRRPVQRLRADVELAMTIQDLRTAAFPKLAPEEIARVARCAEARLQRCRDGEALIRAGDRESKFFVVASGELAVLDEAGDQPRT